MAHNSTATLSVIKDYLINKLQRESQQIEDDERKISQYREETAHLRSEIQELKSRSGFGGEASPSERQLLTVYDLENKFVAYSCGFEDVMDVVAEWGSFYVLTRDGKMAALQERDTQTKLEMLFKKNLFVMAINLAKSQHLDSDGLSEIFRHYGDHLYLKGDHDGAIQQYIRTIGKLEPSYVIRKFLDAQRIHNLTAYLQALHRQSLANADHTTLLLNCYTKLKDSSKLEEFIKSSETEVHFDVEIAIKVLRQAGYHRHAVFLAERHQHHEWYLKIQLEDLKNYQEGLRYIGRLPFEQAESNMKRYGKTLMHHVPEGTTLLLKGLCTDYQPSGEASDRGRGHKANSEEFIPIFANNPRELKAFLEHMIEVEPRSPQGVYDTLLELRLQDWAHEQDPERKKILQGDAVSLLRSDNTVFDKALVLCQMHNFKEGVLYLYEKGKLYQQIVHYHMQNEEYEKVVEACKRYGDHEGCLWEQALGYFARKEEDCKAYISEVLLHIDQRNLMPPLLEEEEKKAKPQKKSKISEDITVELVINDVIDPTADELDASKKKLQDLTDRDLAKQEREKTLNSLEAFIFETQDKLHQEEYQQVVTEEEREQISARLSEASDWMDEDGYAASTRQLRERLAQLRGLCRDMFFRVDERRNVFGSLNLTTVRLSGVGSSFQKHSDAESKGIKAHFNMDESGVLLLDRVESVFETVVEEKEEESTLTKLGNTISTLFGGGSSEPAPNATEPAQQT
ncbi:unnamed protein product [Menidia menidia]|uniref:(Atlantic silverside) hypothetical protein n=1 Tax=Menidia menidia TaxID=238744 RepID=A0A8S4BHE9_9TELE|nr:unnamed protein product [Menidia menidia]